MGEFLECEDKDCREEEVDRFVGQMGFIVST